MKTAIMQPYLFPYLGYFQLINAVDVFVFYDDVNFIKKGWVNRNNILVNGTENLFTVPLKKVSQFNQINETTINDELFGKWKNNFFKTLEHSYKKAQFFKETFNLVERVLNSNSESISQLAITSVVETCKYLELPLNYSLSSEDFYHTKKLDRAERLKAICSAKNSSIYINPIGGQTLYSKPEFQSSGIDLKFLQPSLESYKQFNHDFIKGLSIIDVLMFNSPEASVKLISNYDLV